jgi:hypothetical protein
MRTIGFTSDALGSKNPAPAGRYGRDGDALW